MSIAHPESQIHSSIDNPDDAGSMLRFVGYRLDKLSGSALSLLRAAFEADLNRAVQQVRRHGFVAGRAEARDALALLIQAIDVEFAHRDEKAQGGR